MGKEGREGGREGRSVIRKKIFSERIRIREAPFLASSLRRHREGPEPRRISPAKLRLRNMHPPSSPLTPTPNPTPLPPLWQSGWQGHKTEGQQQGQATLAIHADVSRLRLLSSRSFANSAGKLFRSLTALLPFVAVIVVYMNKSYE